MKRTMSLVWDNYALFKNVKSTISASQCNFWVLIAIFILSIGNNLAFAGQWQTLDEGEYSIYCPSGNYQTGDTIEYILELGDASNPFEDLSGVELQLTLADYAIVVSGMAPDTSDSWLFEGSEYTYSVEHSPHLRTLDILLERTDGGFETGHGNTFRFSLVCDRDNTESQELIESDGGIILVENIELKTSGGGAGFGDPFGEGINTAADDQPVRVQAYKLGEATPVKEWHASPSEPIIVGGLPKGMMVLVVTTQSGRVSYHKILVH